MNEKKIQPKEDKIEMSDDSKIDKMIYSMKFGEYLVKFEISMN